jgi:hypothetical protein
MFHLNIILHNIANPGKVNDECLIPLTTPKKGEPKGNRCIGCVPRRKTGICSSPTEPLNHYPDVQVLGLQGVLERGLLRGKMGEI